MDEDSADRQEGKTDNCPEDAGTPETSRGEVPPVAGSMTLEQIIDVTGEFSHLNDLVMIHIEKSGGFVGADAYFLTVNPILDLLEKEIRVRCTAGMTQQEMKLVVQDWIDREIRTCMERSGTSGP